MRNRTNNGSFGSMCSSMEMSFGCVAISLSISSRSSFMKKDGELYYPLAIFLLLLIQDLLLVL